MSWQPDWSRYSDDELARELRQYMELRYPAETTMDGVFGWYAMIAMLLGAGALVDVFLHGINVVSGASLVVAAPAVWILMRDHKRTKHYDRTIDHIRAEQARR